MSGSSLLVCATAFAAVIVAGCGAEVGRIEFADVGDGRTEVTIDSSKNVDFWTHLDLVAEEDDSLAVSILTDKKVSLAYSIAMYHQGEMMKRVTCDALDVNEFDFSTKFRVPGTSFRTARSFRYNGKMKCSTSVPNSGPITVEAELEPIDPTDGAAIPLPESYKLTRADLVIKQ